MEYQENSKVIKVEEVETGEEAQDFMVSSRPKRSLTVKEGREKEKKEMEM